MNLKRQEGRREEQLKEHMRGKKKEGGEERRRS